MYVLILIISGLTQLAHLTFRIRVKGNPPTAMSPLNHEHLILLPEDDFASRVSPDQINLIDTDLLSISY